VAVVPRMTKLGEGDLKHRKGHSPKMRQDPGNRHEQVGTPAAWPCADGGDAWKEEWAEPVCDASFETPWDIHVHA
jgi:hypothetical protein